MYEYSDLLTRSIYSTILCRHFAAPLVFCSLVDILVLLYEMILGSVVLVLGPRPFNFNTIFSFQLCDETLWHKSFCKNNFTITCSNKLVPLAETRGPKK